MRFSEYLVESTHQDDVHGLGQYTSQFLQHLSSPVGAHEHDHGIFEWTHPALEKDDGGKLKLKGETSVSAPSHPENYHLTLSHTGTGHAESNDHHVINALNAGHVVAMVYQRGKGIPHPTHVEDIKTGKRWRLTNGDDDDNTFDRHAKHGIPKGEGVVSGLKLKGVSNERAGAFANQVDPDGIIRINKPADTYTHAPAAPKEKKHLPKTQAIIDKGEAERPEGNLHQRIHHGLSKAFGEMQTDSPEVHAAKTKESLKAWHEFTKARGYSSKSRLDFMGSNGKTEKSTGEGVKTIGVGLAPHSLSGLDHFDVCPRSSTECRANCLGTEAGGNKQYPDSSLAGKVLRTHFMAFHPEHAARVMDHEITKHKEKAKKEGMIAGVRLNITSDMPYEKYARPMFDRHKDVQFYDYSKIHGRVMGQNK